MFDDRDPYELHALRFLHRHQQISDRLYRSLNELERHQHDLKKYWPQILVAFGWSMSNRTTSPAAAEFCKRFMAGQTLAGNVVLPASPTELEKLLEQ
jgi:hypothetical protein